jgi:hypothetical protein
MISEATVVYFGVNIKILNNVFDFFAPDVPPWTRPCYFSIGL